MSTIEIEKGDYDSIPDKKAVYSIWAQNKTTNKPMNCRYVGETEDLRKRTGEHFGESEQNKCLKKFMQSTKTKLMVYELMPNSTKEDRLEKEKAWIKKHSPECNE